MAEPLDIPVDAAGVKQLVESMKALAEVNLSKAISELGQYTALLQKQRDELKGIQQGTQAWREKNEVMLKTQAIVEALNKGLGGFVGTLAIAKTELSGMREEFEGTNLGGLGLDKTMSNLAQTMLGLGAAGALLGTKTGRALLQPFSEAKDMVSMFGSTMAALNEVFRKNAEAQDLVNVGYLGLGKSMGEIKGRGDLVIDAVQKTAAQFFISSQEQQKFVNATRMVPEALNSVTTAAEGTGKNMTQMAQYLLVARGAGVDAAGAATLLNTSFREFGESAMPKVAEAFVKFKAAAAAGGVSVDIAMEQIKAASSPFAIFGAKITEAQNVWVTFKTALKDVPVAQVGQLTQTVSQGIAGMSLNTQAFVAQMSGMAKGASALGGALRMELEMREPGGMEKNLERVQQAISKLGGGRIITLQEAAQNPAMEMQFQMQRQLAGQMLGVQGSGQQSRVLEVLQGVEKGGMTSATASKSMQDLMSDGQKAQSASTTAMEKTAMGVGRTASLLNELKSIEQAAGTQLERIGDALGARGVGAQLRESDVSRATRAVPAAGRAALRAAKRAAPRIGRETQTYLTGGAKGLRAETRERNRIASRAIGREPPIEVDRPARRDQRRTARALPAATRQPLPLFGGTGDDAFSMFNSQAQGRTRTTDMMSPMFHRRPELKLPDADTEEGGGRFGRAGRGARQEAEAEVRAEPLVPENITVKVICEQCNHKLAEKIERLSQEGRGE